MTDVNSLNFDEKNPAKTLADLAHIDELKAQKFLSDLPLTDYIAVCIAMQSKDLKKLNAIIGKHKLAEDQYHEAIDLKVADELKKISQMSSHQNTKVVPSTNSSVPSAPSANTTTTGTIGTTGLSNTNNVSSTGTNVSLASGGTSAPALNLSNVQSADSKTGTVVIKNPQTKKIEIKSIKDPKQGPEITALIKNAGL